MSVKHVLQAIAIVSLLGMLFSGALTWREFAHPGAPSCSALGTPGTLLGSPPCVYGLVMYTIVFALAIMGLRRISEPPLP